MPPLSLAARITLIMIVALTAAWIGAIAIFYRAYDPDGDSSRPPPARLAALARLVETAPRERRADILAAVSSGTLRARLATGAEASGGTQPAGRADEALRRRYADALGNRHVSISSSPASLADKRFPRLWAAVTDALELEIGLETGETLVVETRSPFSVNRLGLPVGLGAGLFGTFVALIALIVMHRETRPLARLATAVDRIDLTGEPVPLPRLRTSAPEIRALIAAFERLQSRLSDLLRARMAMLGGISHDVRTFATRLRLRVDAIADPGQRERAAADISDMIRLLDDALLASRSGAGELNEEMVEFDRIVAAEVEDRKAAGAAVALAVAAGAAGATVLGDRLALRRVVANLTDNALQYGRAAHLRLDDEGDELVLTVDDEGPGIPAGQRALLLEPFVRRETSRNRDTGGAGLGLAIARGLVEAHGGTIAIGDAPSGGARFTVSLPVFRP